MLNADIIHALETFAPPSLQEEWDNTGLQVGTLDAECRGVLICFDVTPAIVAEAIEMDYNLIISHHPLFFKGVKRLTGATDQQTAAINAITAGISIYSTHTAIDSAYGGVSYSLARAIGITAQRVLDPLADRMVKLQVTVPVSHAEVLRQALFAAGAGAIGNYDCCSYNVEGTGTFRACKGAMPFVGTPGEYHREAETEISMILERDRMRAVEQALIAAHPYETPAYQFVALLNRLPGLGLGIYGTLEQPADALTLVHRVKEATGAQAVRTTPISKHPGQIQRVAVCGGAGRGYIGTALAMGAQAYVTADLSYHDFVDYQDKILLIDAGHYETEHHIKRAIQHIIEQAYPQYGRIACTRHNDNPINYI